MQIKEINENEFDNYVINNNLRSFYQSSSYGKVADKDIYSTLFIGAYKNNELVGVSLILSKIIVPGIRYGYAPRGFLINYYDYNLLEEFTNNLKRFLSKKGYAFVKINPELTLSEVDFNGNKRINELNNKLICKLQNLGYHKLKDNLYFEAMLPKYNPVIRLDEYDADDINKKTKIRIVNTFNTGQNLIIGDEYQINTFYDFIKNKKNKSLDYYKNFYKIFKEKNMIDLLLVEVNYHEYLENLKLEYEKESKNNALINYKFSKDPKNKHIYNLKMTNDKILNKINDKIAEINSKILNGEHKVIIAGALIIKYTNRINILISGYDKKYSELNPNYFLHFNIIKRYKNNDYKFLDLNGITGDFSKTNPYKGLNDFKLRFAPKVYEYIGEFDLIINKTIYSLLFSTNKLKKEFDKKDMIHIK